MSTEHGPEPSTVRLRPAAILAPLVTVGAVTVAANPTAGGLAAGTVPMLYLAAVVVAALAGGLFASLFAAALAFLAYDFFFVEPRWTLTVSDPNAVVALTVFIGLALATGTLAARLADHAAAADRRARATAALLQFTRRIASSNGRQAVTEALVQQTARMFDCATFFVAPDGDGVFEVQASSPRRGPLTAQEQQRARLALAGAALDGRGVTFKLVALGTRTLGLLGISADRSLGEEENAILSGLLDQAAVALDRSAKAQENATADALRERERTQAALLSSLSHDLRTPLASITGAVTSLRELGDKMDETSRADLLAVIEEEARSLSRLVGNLLDMTRLEAGGVTPRREPVDVGESVAHALARLRNTDPQFTLDVSLAKDLPEVSGDAVMIEQVIFNLIDNARKYGRGTLPPALFARSDKNDVVLSVTDDGPGIPATDQQKVFEKFFRRSVAPGTPGTGLGLAIVRGFVQAMGGSITVESPAAEKRGTRFVVRLPAVRGAA